MTNQLTPQQLLEIARAVEHEKDWQFINDKIRDASRYLAYSGEYEPHKPTERGQAQLMRVVFAVARKCKSIQQVTKLHDLLEMKDLNGLLILAHEVLCND